MESPKIQTEQEREMKKCIEEISQKINEKNKAFEQFRESFSFKIPQDVIDIQQKYQQILKEVGERLEPVTKVLSGPIQQNINLLKSLEEPLKKFREGMDTYKEICEKPKIDYPNIFFPPVRDTKKENLILLKINKIENWLKKLSKDKKNEYSKLVKSNKYLVFYTKDSIELKFNRENGDVILGEVDGNLAPGTQEYKVFLCLLENSSHIADYKKLLSIIYPNQSFEGPLKNYQVERWVLSSVVRNIKKSLGILPKKEAKNNDIFRTLKKQKAFSLSLR
jgi:hypothetical protein